MQGMCEIRFSVVRWFCDMNEVIVYFWFYYLLASYLIIRCSLVSSLKQINIPKLPNYKNYSY